MSEEVTTVSLVCLNSKGRALVSVGPFGSPEEAINFYTEGKVGRAYHGYTVVAQMTPTQYMQPAQS